MTQPAARIDPDEFLARARTHERATGRLPLPDIVTWPIYPFEGDLRVRRLADVTDEEPRAGEDGSDGCGACSWPDEAFVWTDDRWRVGMSNTSVPVAMLYARDHVDFDELDDEAAAAIGQVLVRLVRALESVPGIARAHVNRWSDGGKHLHVWVIARPARLRQFRGTFLAEWMQILPAMPPEQSAAIAAHVALSWRPGTGRRTPPCSPRNSRCR